MLLRKLRSVLPVPEGVGSGLPEADIMKYRARGSCRTSKAISSCQYSLLCPSHMPAWALCPCSVCRAPALLQDKALLLPPQICLKLGIPTQKGTCAPALRWQPGRDVLTACLQHCTLFPSMCSSGREGKAGRCCVIIREPERPGRTSRVFRRHK